MSEPTVVFRTDPTDRLICVTTLGPWLIKTFENADGQRYEIMTWPDKEEGKEDENRT